MHFRDELKLKTKKN